MLKEKIICPACGKLAKLHLNEYLCKYCNWSSSDSNTIDISYKSEISSTLSNLYPHKFTMPSRFTSEYISEDSLITCLSMESFLQSLKIPNAKAQKFFCENYSGIVAWKAKLTLPDWRKDQILYWQGKKIQRQSEDYNTLLNCAYNKLFKENIFFKEVVLPHFKNYYLIHSTGCDDPKETVLTEQEYIGQLKRLMSKIK